MTLEQCQALLALARGAIAERLGIPFVLPDLEPLRAWLEQPAATFVTLRENGRLRGCIGTLEARRPLEEDVRANAVAAAFHDPRFAPLAREEYPRITVEVSLLSEPEPLPSCAREEDLYPMLRPGLDGVILRYGPHRATFLPQVWRELPDRKQFLAHLKLKAGLDPAFWDPAIEVWRYQVDKCAEGEEEASCA